MDEIPEALRTSSYSQTKQSKQPLGLILAILGGGVAIALGLSVFRLGNQNNTIAETPKTPVEKPETETVIDPKVNTKAPPPENVLGHLKYEEVEQSQLKAITNDGAIKLRIAAADKFRQMQSAARQEGIILTPISGFRSVAQQDYLFFQIKENRRQDTSKRAEVSAPPGYSEHHTGYAVDIGDGRVPATNLNTNFENTAAFKWLQKNAARYSFELSYPRDNLQGINYEPWHWRYVGDRHSLETFYKARNLAEPLK